MTVSMVKMRDTARPTSMLRSSVDTQVTNHTIWVMQQHNTSHLVQQWKEHRSSDTSPDTTAESVTVLTIWVFLNYVIYNLSSHQINLAAPPQCHDVRVLLEHALQIHKDNHGEDSLKQAHPHSDDDTESIKHILKVGTSLFSEDMQHCSRTFGSSWNRDPSFSMVTNTIRDEAIPAICKNNTGSLVILFICVQQAGWHYFIVEQRWILHIVWEQLDYMTHISILMCNWLTEIDLLCCLDNK